MSIQGPGQGMCLIGAKKVSKGVPKLLRTVIALLQKFPQEIIIT